MSSPLQVRIARAGKEVGSYDSAEALRLLGLGTLKPTDHYWHEGMTSWALLSDLEKVRQEALERVVKARLTREAVDQEVEARLAEERAKKHREKKSIGVGVIVLVVGVIWFLGALSSQRSGDKLTLESDIVWAGASVLIGLGLIIEKLFKKK